jgi:hypothetical protein
MYMSLSDQVNGTVRAAGARMAGRQVYICVCMYTYIYIYICIYICLYITALAASKTDQHEAALFVSPSLMDDEHKLTFHTGYMCVYIDMYVYCMYIVCILC